VQRAVDCYRSKFAHVLGSVRPRPGKALVLELIRQMELRQKVEMGLTGSAAAAAAAVSGSASVTASGGGVLASHHHQSGSASGSAASSSSHSVNVLHLQPDEANAVGLLAGGLGGTVSASASLAAKRGLGGGSSNSGGGSGLGSSSNDAVAAELLQNFYHHS
jgi:hypothetical protein